jgi:prolyl-tRNA editing enzyme YbaK/EbsC (Cys-tRNA(Pro) deacylase)
VPSADERFAEGARARGLSLDIRRWPEGTRTASEAAAAVGCGVEQIVKSLVFVVDGEPVLALTSGANRVDTDRLADVLGAGHARKADAGEVRAATGYAIGGTPPFGSDPPLRTVLDPGLLAHDEVWAAAGTPETTFPISPERLREAAEAEVADFTER